MKNETKILFFIFSILMTTSLRAQIEIESVSTEKEFRIEYDSTINIPNIRQNLVGQSLFVLPLDPKDLEKGYESFYSTTDFQMHYLTNGNYSDTPREKLAGKTLDVIGFKTINKGDVLKERTYLELKRKDNNEIIYSNGYNLEKEVICIGYFEKLKKNLVGKECYIKNDFFSYYNIINHKEIIHKNDIWTIQQIVYDENLENLVVKFRNKSDELCAANYSDWSAVKYSLDFIDKETNGYLESNSVNDPNEIFVTVEQMPEFIGGQEALFQYISKEIKYPVSEKENNIQGSVYLKFIIDENGKPQDIQVSRGVKGGTNLDNEAIRIVKSMPLWKPGKHNGKPVKVWYSLPIKFSLR